jgi:Protein of unknown function (DUF3102)
LVSPKSGQNRRKLAKVVFVKLFQKGVNESHINNGPEPEIQDTQKRTLAELEDVVEKGKTTFVEVGEALIEIRTRGLYGPKGWEEYLEERFHFSRQHANRLMQATRLFQTSPVDDKPATEREARKRLSEKRAKRKQPEPRSKLIHDVDAEFEQFKSTVERWQQVLAHADYLHLVGKVASYTGDILSEADYSDDIVGNQTVEEPEEMFV